MKIKNLPSQEYLQECFNYDPETGILTWKERPLHHFKSEREYKTWNKRFSNTKSGYYNNYNYLMISINHNYFYAHRIVWKLMTGNDPIEFIDHINGNKSDNRFCNLRGATNSENNRNCKTPVTNTSGYKGVHYSSRDNVWISQIKLNNRLIYLGSFNTPEEAYEAYCKASSEYHKEFSNLG